MSSELKALFKKMLFYDLGIGSCIFIIICIIFNLKLALIFFIGLLISIVNFVASGFILEKSINNHSKITKILLPLSYIIRILIIILLSIPFLNELKMLIAYLLGFITHFPILTLSWLNSQKGSE